MQESVSYPAKVSVPQDNPFENGLKEFGFAIEQIERILITDAHVDHFGQARRL
jgi:glyoxylase-like metal-dependent hydrolase (beta-lactamase superfamily II)